MGRAIGIDYISVVGLHPVEFVKLARRLGCDHIGIGLEPGGDNPHGYAPWSLRSDAGLRRDLKRALADHDVTISIGDGLLGRPDVPAAAVEADLDLFAELGVTTANLVSLDPDRDRASASIAAFADAARARGMRAVIEFLPGLPLASSLPAAVDLVERAGSPNLGVVIDAMHTFRSGASVADIAALAPGQAGYLQLCDVPMPALPGIAHHEEARYERRIPGDGDLPLAELLRAVPSDLVIALEVPQRALAQAGMGPEDRLRPAVERTRALLAGL